MKPNLAGNLALTPVPIFHPRKDLKMPKLIYVVLAVCTYVMLVLLR